ncbi:hypothetical protein T552_02269 [Pneumocystis carinii B80]|uniref:SEC7 domain-containing protein n=1 Tax=Pneumocystis carinii (strain B80) TaxID=1408658 RepID=A0A0W4ZFZ0_PNEC8|nr:hypothetical protein T552_02269 [Pneumocystis carinii B80]KTW27286.1 hypothetical protein T552_02269 [Pneumocystis carinii B80]
MEAYRVSAVSLEKTGFLHEGILGINDSPLFSQSNPYYSSKKHFKKKKDNILLETNSTMAKTNLLKKESSKFLPRSISKTSISKCIENDMNSNSLTQPINESPKHGLFSLFSGKNNKNSSPKKPESKIKNLKNRSVLKKSLVFNKKNEENHNSCKNTSKSPTKPSIPKSISSVLPLTSSLDTKSHDFDTLNKHSSFLDNNSSWILSNNANTMKSLKHQEVYHTSLKEDSSGSLTLKENISNFSSTTLNETNFQSFAKDKQNNMTYSYPEDLGTNVIQDFRQSATDYSELSFVSARDVFDISKNSFGDISNREIRDSLTKSDNTNDRDIDVFIRDQSLKYNASIIGKSIFYGEETYVSKAKAASWLGDCMALNSEARTLYMNQFDWTGLDILTALRRLCSKLIMKAETQQMDRILESFSKRWHECNASSNLTSDIVHAIAYSLLLLNTDLHVADLTHGQKMTKNQFVQNTLSTIFSSKPKPKADLYEFFGLSLMGSHLSSKHTMSSNSVLSDQSSGIMKSNLNTLRKSSNKFFIKKASNTPLNETLSNSVYFEVEAMLKEMYTSIKNFNIVQPVINDFQFYDAQSNNSQFNTTKYSDNFYLMSLNHASSFSSKSISETTRGKYGTKKLKIKNWANKKKTLSRIYYDNFHSSVSSNINDWSSGSGNRSSNFPIIENRSVCSFNSSCYSTNTYDYQFSTIGFAGALNTFIKKTPMCLSNTLNHDYDTNEENELALSGPPWTKEGILKHKHYLENFKKAKHRAWVECFVVLEKGRLTMFQFNNDKFLEKKGIIGSGNWIENARIIGSFILLQTLASSLPPPGYSPTRPYVWILTLPNGCVHFFQAGTRELLNEWVYTANYWAARFSKEPLLGGVSNVEYGWGECLKEINNRKGTKNNEKPLTSHNSTKNESSYLKLPGDKAIIKTWSSPQVSLFSNSLKEEEQVKKLRKYITILENDVQKHNAYRPQILQAFSPRHPNLAKALLNWEKKSQYLLREIVKYKTYLETLSRALVLKEERLSRNNTTGSNCNTNE